MKVLLAGSSGHLGEAIARTFIDQGQDYVGLDIKPSAFTHEVGSIADPSFVEHCFRNIDFVINTATLHKPHVATHNQQAFIDTNISGTLNLLEASVKHGVKAFIFTSTTSTFGDMLTPKEEEPAIWVTEETIPIPKNIYGATKTAAEDICQLFFRNYNLPCIILKTSRFFPEADDKKSRREQYDDQNLKAVEYLYRRVDIADVVSAHVCAMKKVERIGFAKYIISATSPFLHSDLKELHQDASTVVQRYYPSYLSLFATKGWKMLPKIDRVYVNAKAGLELDWRPRYDFQHVLDCLEVNADFRSQLSKDVGSKGYHSEVFSDGPYPVSGN